jgi:hypothetical protein
VNLSLDRSGLDFDRWWTKHGQAYEQAVTDAGDLPWPLDPVKRRRVAALLGLPEGSDPMTLRRALWERRNRSNTP